MRVCAHYEAEGKSQVANPQTTAQCPRLRLWPNHVVQFNAGILYYTAQYDPVRPLCVVVGGGGWVHNDTVHVSVYHA